MCRACFRLALLFIDAHSIRVARPCHASAMFRMQGRTEAEVGQHALCQAQEVAGLCFQLRPVALLSCGFCSHVCQV